MSETNCKHLDFTAHVEVGRIQKSDQEPDVIIYYSANLKVACRHCGQELEFVGLPLGLSAYRPTVSMNGNEVHLPMVIPGEAIPDGLPGYSVKFTPGERPQ